MKTSVDFRDACTHWHQGPCPADRYYEPNEELHASYFNAVNVFTILVETENCV